MLGETMEGIVPADRHREHDVDMSSTPSTTNRLVRRRPRGPLRLRFIRQRELGNSARPPPALLSWIEGETLRKLDTGTYVELDKTSHLVRSTISIAFSHDGCYFASTHGDHSVKVFEYPSRKQVASLVGHPRTPWSVRFHPQNSSIVASGCLGGECRVWNISKRKCIHKHTFTSKISCVAFNPSGEFLAVTCARQLLLWKYGDSTMESSGSARTFPEGPLNTFAQSLAARANYAHAPGMPYKLIGGNKAFHMVDFHPSGHLLMTGESNRAVPTNTANPHPPPHEQFTLKLVIHRFDRRMGVKFARPILEVPRAVAYNDAGTHFSPCGTMLAACVPVTETSQEFHIAVLSLINTADRHIGQKLYSAPLDKDHVTALTNLKFSSTSKHLLAGFSFPRGNPVLRTHAEDYDMHAALNLGEGGAHVARLAPCGAPMNSPHPQVRVVDIYHVDESFPLIRSLGADIDINDHNVGGAEDEINVAVFAPSRGVADGVLYGTQKGRIRMFQHANGRKSFPPGVCDENCKFRRPHSLRSLLNPTSPPALPSPTAPVPVPPLTWARYAAFTAATTANPPTVSAFVPLPGVHHQIRPTPSPAPLPQYALPSPMENPPRGPALTGEARALAEELRAVYADLHGMRRRLASESPSAGNGTLTPAPPALPPINIEEPEQNFSRPDDV